MLYSPILPIWKEAPFIRLLIPFIAGILCQWYYPLPIVGIWLLFIASILAGRLFSFTRLSHQYHAQWLHGAFLHIMLFTTGFLLFYYKDVRHQLTCITTQYASGNAVLVTIEEPLTEKKQSYKTVASVQALLFNNTTHNACGKILLYFPKDSATAHLEYGNQLILFKALQPVKNTGNPGSFDYQRYCTFQGIVYQAYLKQDEYIALKIKNENLFRKCVLSTREKIVSLLKKYIPGKKEAGLAEAMLIGYKDDLDKELVQSYSGTGVVHIIAISGLHLALIYWLLGLITRPFTRRKHTRFLQPVFIITGLWVFSFMAGASPSVLRSAVMFTCVVLGASINRKTSLYNSLAASAFLLLCYNPFWLWDAGFQLSYAAVLSLGIFFKPVYHLLFIQNKIVDLLWKSTAVTLAAQLLTVPVSVYYFHQFPNLFLIANLVAVPVSGIIIIGTILLCATYFIPVIASVTGYLLHYLILWLNNFIEGVNKIPFAITSGLQISFTELIFVYTCISATAWWFLHKNKTGAYLAIASLFMITLFRTAALWSASQQQKIIVYNIPRHSAIDVISGQHYYFKGDSDIIQDPFIQNFYLQPCRLLHRLNNRHNPGNILVWKNLFRLGHTTFMVVDQPPEPAQTAPKIAVDCIVLSKNPSVTITGLTDVFTCRRFVFDPSNPVWKVAQWRQECSRLGISCFSVADQGAFVLNVY